MKYDIVCAGVGGQGVLSVAALVAYAAMREGLSVRQSEVHGMAQRGGAVMSFLRLSDTGIASDLIPRGYGDMILSMEPMESLRYLDYLNPDGVIVTASEPVVNIPDYPDLETLLAAVRSVPGSHVVDTQRLARECGFSRAANVVLVGAASRFLPLSEEGLENGVRSFFSAKGQEVVAGNLSALRTGRTGGGR